MPLHVKPSDQRGRQGKLIFDPVGTNEYIKNALVKLKWQNNIVIPAEYRFLGKEIDFVKAGIILEIQFSNYPFLLNNTLRSELLFKAGTMFAKYSTQLVIIITKAQMFPASNSTLYYEQAAKQLEALIKNHVFDVPIRLIGLFEQPDTITSVISTVYQEKRYSRIVQARISCQGQLISGKLATSRCKIHLIQ
ncbi:restriction endonuclease [Fortiea sp. LEGE XX443]|uniref:restriction endonuclease n=1 Tax=Fortiea sp. LEGE XX443 TaxID=1828611 RepID=UPI001D136BE5|nr:restriction endonuclease [Fortiea sp. LEGE XX443]